MIDRQSRDDTQSLALFWFATDSAAVIVLHNKLKIPVKCNAVIAPEVGGLCPERLFTVPLTIVLTHDVRVPFPTKSLSERGRREFLGVRASDWFWKVPRLPVPLVTPPTESAMSSVPLTVDTFLVTSAGQFMANPNDGIFDRWRLLEFPLMGLTDFDADRSRSLLSMEPRSEVRQLGTA